MNATTELTIAVPAALAAAAAFGLAAALQHRQAQQVSAAQTRATPAQGQRAARPQGQRAARPQGQGAARPRAGAWWLLARLARQPLWLAGIALSVLGYGLQAAALAFGPLTLVAPIVATDLMFALPVAARWSGRRLTGRDWAGCALTAGGVAAFLVTAPESSGRSDAAAGDWLLAFGAVALACALAIVVGRHLYPAARAASTAVAAGLTDGLAAAVTLSLTRLVRAEGLWPALAHWQPWALAGLGLSGLALTMGAFQAAALGASLPVIDTVEPVAGVLIGTVVFGEQLAGGPSGLAVQAMGAAAAVAGIVLLGSTPRQRRAGTAGSRPGLGERRRNRTGRENSAPAGVSLAAGDPERGQA
jgi:drug/metabolite transporter (DMT)-like permease